MRADLKIALLLLAWILIGCQNVKVPQPGVGESSAMADQDHDRVANIKDRCPDTPAYVSVGPDGCPVSRILEQTSNVILFNRGSALIGPGNEKKMAYLVAQSRRFPAARIVIEGHADACGSDADDMQLSEQRAKNTAAGLMAAGLDPSRIGSVRGLGHRRPEPGKPSRCDQPLNDRVIVIGEL